MGGVGPRSFQAINCPRTPRPVVVGSAAVSLRRHHPPAEGSHADHNDDREPACEFHAVTSRANFPTNGRCARQVTALSRRCDPFVLPGECSGGRPQPAPQWSFLSLWPVVWDNDGNARCCGVPRQIRRLVCESIYPAWSYTRTLGSQENPCVECADLRALDVVRRVAVAHAVVWLAAGRRYKDNPNRSEVVTCGHGKNDLHHPMVRRPEDPGTGRHREDGRGAVDNPRPRGWTGVCVTGRIDSPHGKRVPAVCKVRICLRTPAGGEYSAIQAAAEGEQVGLGLIVCPREGERGLYAVRVRALRGTAQQ